MNPILTAIICIGVLMISAIALENFFDSLKSMFLKKFKVEQ